MKWRFWEKEEEQKQEETVVEVVSQQVEPTYDEELESFLKQSQVYPYLKQGLHIIDQALTGQICFYKDAHIEQSLKDCKIDFWYITENSIYLKVYTRRHERILDIDACNLEKKFIFKLNLPLEDGNFEPIFIEKTRTYAEFKSKLFQLLDPHHVETLKQVRTRHVLQSDARKHRLQNLFN